MVVGFDDHSMYPRLIECVPLKKSQYINNLRDKR